MQEAFDKLSPEEIDLLNSDEQMLSQFKAKYAGMTKGGAKIPIPSDVVNEQGVQPASILSDIQRGSAQGLGALGALTAKPNNSGLQEAAGIAQGEDPTSTAGKIGNFVGQSVSPAALAAGAGVGKVAEAAAPALTKAAKVAFAPLKSTSAEAMNAAEKGAGVVLRSPITKQIARDLGLPKGSQTFGEVTNAMVQKLDQGAEVPLQTVKDFLLKGDTVLKNPIGSGEKAALSQAMSKARQFLNTNIPSRGPAAADFGNAATRSNLLKMAGMGGGAVGTGAAAWQAFKRITAIGR